LCPRVLASNGIDLPVLNVFRMFGKMGGRRLAMTSSADAGVESILTNGVRDPADVSALPSLDENRLYVLAWHYHDDDIAGPAAAVELSLIGLPAGTLTAKPRHYRIDSEHSNAFESWKRMGSPAIPVVITLRVMIFRHS
jgi:xylan 1,4-beta-xylosidase